MRTTKTIVYFIMVILFSPVNAQIQVESDSLKGSFDYVSAFKVTLNSLAEGSDNDFFKMHCQSIISVINAKNPLTAIDSSLIENTYNAFNNTATSGNAKLLTSYLERQRPFILAWQSPTDGKISYSQLKLPRNWDPEMEYPLYIELHGLWSVADNPIEFMTYPFRNEASSSYAFQDGYYLYPWGRGNLWYQGISETDIWECIDALEAIVKVNPKRKYLCGHSMGGYGAWMIASKSADTWAALGIHAGALWYNNNELLTNQVAKKLKNVPTYFVCGTQDNLLGINQLAYQLLITERNTNLSFVTFNGAHEYFQVNVENMYFWMKNFENNDWVSIPDSSLAKASQLSIFPNPCSDKVQINYTLKSPGKVKIEIVSQNGQVVQILKNDFHTAGQHHLIWEPGNNFSTGVYFVRQSDNDQIITKIVLISRD